MRNSTRWALMMLLAAAAGLAAARSAPMVQPERVLLPTAQAASRGAEGVRAAIITGSQSLGWTVVADEPGKLTLKYNKHDRHEALVDAVSDADGYQLKYVGSVNLNFEPTARARHTSPSSHGYAQPADAGDNVPQIHPNYNRWIANLIRHIGMAAGMSAAAN